MKATDNIGAFDSSKATLSAPSGREIAVLPRACADNFLLALQFQEARPGRPAEKVPRSFAEELHPIFRRHFFRVFRLPPRMSRPYGLLVLSGSEFLAKSRSGTRSDQSARKARPAGEGGALSRVHADNAPGFCFRHPTCVVPITGAQAVDYFFGGEGLNESANACASAGTPTPVTSSQPTAGLRS